MTQHERTNAPGPTSTRRSCDNATYRSLGEQQLSEQRGALREGRGARSGWCSRPLVTIVMLLLPLGIEDQQHTPGRGAARRGGPLDHRAGADPDRRLHRHRRRSCCSASSPPTRRWRRSARRPSSRSSARSSWPRRCSSTAWRKRFAMFVLNLPGVGSSTFRVIIAFGAITCLLSAFVSNTATVAMLLPTAIGILTVIAKLMQEQGRRGRGLRPAAAAGRRRADADARVRRQRRRPAHPGRLAAQPDRPRPDRGGHRREDLVPRLDAHGAARSAR